jgi:putative spermidine/putrescine transport system permease protein
LRAPARIADAGAVTFVTVLATAPLALLVVFSFGRSWFWPEIAPRSWDSSAWKYVFSRDSGLASSLATSTCIAAIVSLVAVAVALPAARSLAWHEFRGKRLLLFLLLLPVLSPPLAAAMGLHAVFLRMGFEDTVAGVALVHLIPALPYAILMLAGSFSRLDPDLEAQARTLGASRYHVFLKVTLPAIAPGAAVAAAFAFLISWSQYLITVLVGGGRVLTLPLTLVAFLNGGDQAIGAALTLVFILPTILIFAVVSRYLRYEA